MELVEEDGGWRMEDGGWWWRMEDGGWKCTHSNNNISWLWTVQSSRTFASSRFLSASGYSQRRPAQREPGRKPADELVSYDAHFSPLESVGALQFSH